MDDNETKTPTPQIGDSIIVYDTDGTELEATVGDIEDDGSLQVDIPSYVRAVRNADGDWEIQDEEDSGF